MSRSGEPTLSQENTMIKKCVALGAAVAALATATPATTGVFNSSERSGDRIMLEPQGDAQALFTFTAQDARLTSASNWVPLQNPAGGPYFGKLDPEALYYGQGIGLGNQGGGQDDVSGFNAHSF
jgi:uncharacterized protein DUF4331